MDAYGIYEQTLQHSADSKDGSRLRVMGFRLSCTLMPVSYAYLSDRWMPAGPAGFSCRVLTTAQHSKACWRGQGRPRCFQVVQAV